MLTLKELLDNNHPCDPEALRPTRLAFRILLCIRDGFTGRHHRTDRWWEKDVLRSDPCSYCGRMGDPVEYQGGVVRRNTADHIIPADYFRWRNEPIQARDNLTAACRACNEAKSNRDLLTFLAEGGMGRCIKKPVPYYARQLPDCYNTQHAAKGPHGSPFGFQRF